MPVHLVGGAVRDLLRGAAPDELDLAVEGDAPAVARRLGGSLQVHDRFGTCTVTIGPDRYDFARTRRETYAAPGALPEVAPASLAEDLRRRDFTVNAIALTLNTGAAGQLSTAAGALADLEAGHLRVLHDASFRDDPTRLLRLARYSARLGFAVEPGTLALATRAVRGGALRTVSGTRIGNELRLLAVERDPIAAFSALRRLGVDAAVAAGFGLGDPGLVDRSFALLPAGGRGDRLVLALALRGVARTEHLTLLGQLAFEAGDRDAILRAAGRAEHLADSLQRASSASQIARAVYGAGAEEIALAGALGPAQAARDWLQRLRHVSLEIGGEDLLAAGLAPGPRIGAGLRAALAAKLDGHVAGREQELAEALNAAGVGG